MSVILCTAGYDHTIRFWEALSGICSRTIQHPESQVNRLCITPDKRYLAAAGRHNVKLYDIKSTNPNPVMTFDGHSNNITGVAFHCEGKWMVTSSEDWSVKVWDTRSGSQQRHYLHTAAVNDVVIHPNQGELISCDRAGTVRIWDLGESRCTHQLIPEADVSMASVSVASDGSLLCAANNKGNVYIWKMTQNREVTTLHPITTFQAHKDYICRVLLSPDVKHLATCSADHTVKIWSLDTNYKAENGDTAASPDDKDKPESIKASSTSSSITNAISNENQESEVAKGKKPEVNGDVKETEDMKIKEKVEDGEGKAKEGEKPPNGALPLETTLANHQRWVWDCAFSADSAYLVTVCSDHYARLWELGSSQIIRQYTGHHRGAVCVALNDYSEPR